MNTNLNKNSIKELNEFLKGVYMGIDAFDNYIENAENLYIKKALLNIQNDYKSQAQWLSGKIENLGGSPALSAGLVYKASELLNQFKNELTINSTQDLLEEVYSTCHTSYVMTENHLKNSKNLDKDSITKINSMIFDYKNHLDIIKSLSNDY